MRKRLTSIAAALALSFAAWAGTPASFPGGLDARTQYINANLRYPEIARQNGIEGVVSVAFTVNTDGSIGNIKIERMIDPDLEAEAIRIVKNMPKWSPAVENGNPVPSSVRLDIPFILE